MKCGSHDRSMIPSFSATFYIHLQNLQPLQKPNINVFHSQLKRRRLVMEKFFSRKNSYRISHVTVAYASILYKVLRHNTTNIISYLTDYSQNIRKKGCISRCKFASCTDVIINKSSLNQVQDLCYFWQQSSVHE